MKRKANLLSLKKKIMTKKALFIQPGKLGDLVVTTPIAKYYYDKGYEVHWPVFDNFINYFDAFEYVNSFTLDASMASHVYYRNQRVDSAAPHVFINTGRRFFKNLNQWIINQENKEEFEIVDFCFTFPGHTNDYNNGLTKTFIEDGKNWIDLKYHLAEVPLVDRWKYKWQHNEEKENKLLEFIKNYSKKKYGSEEYSIVHSYRGGKPLKKINVKNPINFSYINGYEIYDWYKVLKNAQSIICVDSCLSHFVEVIPEFNDIEKHYLGSEEAHFHSYMRNILLNNWVNHSSSDISYGGLIL